MSSVPVINYLQLTVFYDKTELISNRHKQSKLELCDCIFQNHCRRKKIVSGAGEGSLQRKFFGAALFSYFLRLQRQFPEKWGAHAPSPLVPTALKTDLKTFLYLLPVMSHCEMIKHHSNREQT